MRVPRICLACALLATVIVVAAPVRADEIGAKRSQAEALERRITDQGRRLSIANEEYNQAQLASQRATAKAASARVLVATAEKRWNGLRGQLGKRARTLYMHPGAALDAFLGARTFGEVARARVYSKEVLLTDSGLVMEAERARHEVLERAKALDELRARAEQTEGSVASQRARVQKELGTQRALLTNVRGDIARLIEAERKRQLQAAAAVAPTSERRASSSRPRLAPEEPTGPPPAVRSSAAEAVATARAQLGKPYEWAASGPDSFDCSGLTMYAWSAAGVSLPHSSQAQFDSLPHVSRGQIQPGDLLFYGNPIHHVGIYEGGGVMINAPETGENVRRDSIARSDYVGAARP
jgi:peptidoglycan DL-endopeptidase CwlO